MADIKVPEFGAWLTSELLRGNDADAATHVAAYVDYVRAEVDRQKEIAALKNERGRIGARVDELERESYLHNLIG